MYVVEWFGEMYEDGMVVAEGWNDSGANACHQDLEDARMFMHNEAAVLPGMPHRIVIVIEEATFHKDEGWS